MSRITYILVIALLLFSCSKKKDFGPQYSEDPPQPVTKVVSGALVLNEGNFGFGNASLSVIDFDNGEVQNKVFEFANGKKLGDVGQSLLIIDSLAFVVVNNSNKIVVIDLKNFKQVKEIKISGAPRYLVEYENLILISTMGSNSIQALNRDTYEVSPFVQVSGWIEGMVINNGKLFACNRDMNVVDVIDLKAKSLEQRIVVGKEPESLVVDSLGDLWILCTGGYNKNDREQASIYKISTTTLRNELIYQFADIEHSPTRLRLNKEATSVYFINNGIFKLDLIKKGEPALVLEQPKGDIYYGLAVNPGNGHLFVGNAKDYIKLGEVIEIANNSTILNKYRVGIIPQFIGFY
ncbi:MAG: hypothetical protein CL840_14695 [Crocinitomicaceae bacterium]|nr:hypothetical protein [Crocinitomicaceae bacterium]|tara:strand:+ start:18865 stop:19914 length:1050 start_codon:yes stop_codon:yes gene_type:complete